MGQLEDLQRNRLARMQNIQKGFCGDDTEGDIFKAHNVGDVHPNHPDWVWTQLPNGKYDWRVRKGQAKPAPTPAPKPSGEPDFTPKIPQEIASLTNRSDFAAFDAAYKVIGKEIFAEKFPTFADFVKYQQEHVWVPKTKEAMEQYLGEETAGNRVSRYQRQPLSKTAQIAAMKNYYSQKAVNAKKAYQEKKNADYWAGEGAKRKAEIEQERQEQIAIRKKAVEDAKGDIEKIFGSNTGYEVAVRLSDYGDYKLGVKVGNKTWDSVSLDVRKHFLSKNDDFEVEFSHGSTSYDFNDPEDVKMAQAVFHCGNIMAQNAAKIKDILIKHGAIYAATKDRLDKLNDELQANH